MIYFISNKTIVVSLMFCFITTIKKQWYRYVLFYNDNKTTVLPLLFYFITNKTTVVPLMFYSITTMQQQLYRLCFIYVLYQIKTTVVLFTFVTFNICFMLHLSSRRLLHVILPLVRAETKNLCVKHCNWLLTLLLIVSSRSS